MPAKNKTKAANRPDDPEIRDEVLDKTLYGSTLREPIPMDLEYGVLDEAMEIVVSGDRRASYGEPIDNWSRTASIWSIILDTAVTPEQAVMCMIGTKLARLTHKYKRDSVVDIAGYAAVLAEVVAAQEPGNGS